MYLIPKKRTETAIFDYFIHLPQWNEGKNVGLTKAEENQWKERRWGWTERLNSSLKMKWSK